MASRRNYYYRELVTNAELNAGFQGLEDADHNLMLDLSMVGIASGAVVTQHAGTPNLTVDVTGPGIAYDEFGQRILIPSLQTKDVSVDDSSTATTVSGVGNEKWVSLFVKFQRNLSDPRVDGNSNTVYFQSDESYKWSVIQGSEAPVGTATRPALATDGILLADIQRTQGQTQILNANISTSRRQDMLVASGSPQALRRGLLKDALTDFVGWYNNHVTGVADRHTAAMVDWTAGGATWAGGTSPAFSNGTSQVTISKIINDLAALTSGASGAHRSGCDARSNWLDSTTNVATTTFAAINKIITDLTGHSSPVSCGATKVGFATSGSLLSSDVGDALTELDTGWGKLTRNNTWGNTQTFTNAIVLNADPPISLSSRSVTRTICTGFGFSIATPSYTDFAASLNPNDVATQSFKPPHGATLTGVTLNVSVSSTAPTNKIKAQVVKTHMTTGAETVISTGGTYVVDPAGTYHGVHDFPVGILAAEVIDRTVFRYRIELVGETGSGTGTVGWQVSTWTATMTSMDEGA
jgi:hypothetical protein